MKKLVDWFIMWWDADWKIGIEYRDKNTGYELGQDVIHIPITKVFFWMMVVSGLYLIVN